MLTSCTPYVPWKQDEKRECIFVIIGKHLEQKWLEDQFKNAAIKPAALQEIKNQNLEENYNNWPKTSEGSLLSAAVRKQAEENDGRNQAEEMD